MPAGSAPSQSTRSTPRTRRIHLTLQDRFGNEVTLAPEQLSAAGITSSFTSRTTAAPLKPVLKGKTAGRTPCCWNVQHEAQLSITQAVGGPAHNAIIVDSVSSACGTYHDDGAYAQIVLGGPNPLLPCTVKLRAVNAAGASPQASLTFY